VDNHSREIKGEIKIPEFPVNRLFLLLAGAIILAALIGGIYSIYLLSEVETAANNPDGTDQMEFSAENPEISGTAEVLPQQRRDSGDLTEGVLWSSYQPMVDPFADPMRLTGILSGGRGRSMAIIESSGTSYIVLEGDYVDDLWAVREISAEMVIMRAYNQEVSLFLDQPPVTRMLDGGFDVEEQEEGE